jgi:SAM-dependent methyltransferase
MRKRSPAAFSSGHSHRGNGDANRDNGVIRRLHWGCGPLVAPGWINSDVREFPGVDICCDILNGLPLEDDSIDYISSQHALPEIGLWEQEPALRELRRVLKPAGVFRTSLPDFDSAIAAYQEGRRDRLWNWNWETVDGDFIEFVVDLPLYVRMIYTYIFAEELASKAGFSEVRRVAFRETASAYPEIVELDNRPDESFYLEAVK